MDTVTHICHFVAVANEERIKQFYLNFENLTWQWETSNGDYHLYAPLSSLLKNMGVTAPITGIVRDVKLEYDQQYGSYALRFKVEIYNWHKHIQPILSKIALNYSEMEFFYSIHNTTYNHVQHNDYEGRWF